MRKFNAQIDYYAVLDDGEFYHVYNRTNNREHLFRDDYDRKFFLQRLEKFIAPYADIYSYCLLGNHFHLQIRVKQVEIMTEVVEKISPPKRTVTQAEFLKTSLEKRTTDQLLVMQFMRFFTSYSICFNNRYSRNGNLFARRFKRVKVENEMHFLRLIYYIHANPVKHKLMSDFRSYQWSSYLEILSDEPTILVREEVLEWFSGRNGFIDFHLNSKDFKDELKNYLLDE